MFSVAWKPLTNGILISVRIREYSNGLLFLYIESYIISVDCLPSCANVTLSSIFSMPRISKKTLMTSRLYYSSSTTRILPNRSYSLLYMLVLSDNALLLVALKNSSPNSFLKSLLRPHCVTMFGISLTLFSSVGRMTL